MPDSDWVLVWDFVGVIKTANYKLRQSWVGLVAYVCNPSAQDTEAGGLLRVPGVFDPVLKKKKQSCNQEDPKSRWPLGLMIKTLSQRKETLSFSRDSSPEANPTPTNTEISTANVSHTPQNPQFPKVRSVFATAI